MTVKTRFAPSPTGYLHVGGARTALYSWLYAKSQGGEFVLRIEDTDIERSTQEAVDAILEGMQWMGLDWDEGPYYQTKRFDRYNEMVDKLLTEDKAYKCYASKELLDEIRTEQEANKEMARYDANHPKIVAVNQAAKDGEPCVIRFRNPKEGSVVFEDQIRGRIEISNSQLDDLIIRRTDGSPSNTCYILFVQLRIAGKTVNRFISSLPEKSGTSSPVFFSQVQCNYSQRLLVVAANLLLGIMH